MDISSGVGRSVDGSEAAVEIQSPGLLERALRSLHKLGRPPRWERFGVAALSPITGAATTLWPWQETLITALFMSVGLAIVGSSILVLWGLRRKAAAGKPLAQSQRSKSHHGRHGARRNQNFYH